MSSLKVHYTHNVESTNGAHHTYTLLENYLTSSEVYDIETKSYNCKMYIPTKVKVKISLLQAVETPRVAIG
jgi:hypothetical protein